MDSKQIEKILQIEMNELVSKIKTATNSTDGDFKSRESAFRTNPETGIFEGYTAVRFLNYPEQRDNLNNAIEKFKSEFNKDVLVKSNYFDDIEMDKVTVALGVNGPEDYNKIKEADKKTGKML